VSRAKQRLRAKGIEANEVSASRMQLVPHTSLVIASKGDALFDPRSLDPVDPEMAANMVDRVNAGETPNRLALLVWERPGCPGLLVGDGHQRTNALGQASKLLGGRALMVLVEFFDGDEKDFLLERARRNDHDRFAKKDRAGILAFRVKQLTAVGATEREIADAMPKGIGPSEVAALARWGSLSADARKLFDDGTFPIGLLAAVLDAPRDEQVATGQRLLAAGVKTAKGATRAANRAKSERDPWARRMSPKQAIRMAADVGNAVYGAQSLEAAIHTLATFGKREGAIVAAGVIAGLYLEANERTADILTALPKSIADAIREARAAKPRKAGAK
jgi:hypothetical protein